jgi:4-aminobutyrate aminotransferase-like enzyme
MGARFEESLAGVAKRQPLIQAVRVRGLMVGLDFPDHDVAVAVEQACFRRGVLVLTCGERSLRLAPPLVIDPEQVDTGVAVLEEAIAEVAGVAA